MQEDFASTVVRLVGQAYGPLAGVLAILGLAFVLVLLRRVGTISWPKMPRPPPDLLENPPSPPIPTANPVTPPDPGPM